VSKGRRAVGDWLLPSLAYAVTLGALGVATKLALRSLPWQELVVWAAACYAIVAVLLITVQGVRLHLSFDGGMAALAGAMAVLGLVLIFVALGRGEVSKVIPVTSSYPLLALLFSAVVLSERITITRAIGAVLIVVGVIVLSR
jgi:bacterial/archaeal transporter family protein